MPYRAKGGKFPKNELPRTYFENKGVGVDVSCAGKFQFNSYDAAAKSIRRVGKTGRRDGRLGPYHCPSCGLYHVGSRI